MNDLDLFMKMGDALAAVNDNLRGLQDSGGRKSATEARTSAEAAASRLASHAKLISSQSIVDLAEQMTINYMQYLSEDFAISVLGGKGQALTIDAMSMSGDFVFPVNDGTLPVDKVALLDVWKEVMMATMQNPVLSQTYDLPKLFEYVADLGGAKGIESMRVASPESIDKAVQAGNMVPMGEVVSGTTPGIAGSPADRIAGALG